MPESAGLGYIGEHRDGRATATPGDLTGPDSIMITARRPAQFWSGCGRDLSVFMGEYIWSFCFCFSGGGLALVCGRYGRAAGGLPVARREPRCQRSGKVAPACAECPAASTSIQAVARLSGGITSGRSAT